MQSRLLTPLEADCRSGAAATTSAGRLPLLHSNCTTVDPLRQRCTSRKYAPRTSICAAPASLCHASFACYPPPRHRIAKTPQSSSALRRVRCGGRDSFCRCMLYRWGAAPLGTLEQTNPPDSGGSFGFLSRFSGQTMCRPAESRVRTLANFRSGLSCGDTVPRHVPRDARTARRRLVRGPNICDRAQAYFELLGWPDSSLSSFQHLIHTRYLIAKGQTTDATI